MIAEPQAAARTGGSPPPAGRGGSHCIAWSAAAGADAPPPARSDIPPTRAPNSHFRVARPASNPRESRRPPVYKQAAATFPGPSLTLLLFLSLSRTPTPGGPALRHTHGQAIA
jgi:hypothetical protein